MPRFLNRRAGPRAAHRSPSTTTPVFDQAIRYAVLGGLAKLALIPLVPAVLLLCFGHPGLRTSYSWNGLDHAPVYYHCRYLTVDGYHRIAPDRAGQVCPIIAFFPVSLFD